MGDRSYLRPYSPPRRGSGHPGRNSASFLDSHSAGFDPYYAYPRSSRDSIPVRQVGDSSRRYPQPRDSLPLRRNDDYEVLPRRADSARRASVVPPGPESPKYRPIIKSATDRVPEYVRTRPRDDESYYLTPASSSRNHHRALSTGGPRDASYPVRTREPYREPYREPFRDRPEREYDRSARQYHNIPPIRQPRDKDDRDFGFEYTDHKEQARRDLLPPARPRPRRDSDALVQARPASIVGIEDLSKRSGRAEGPPVTKRGFSKIDGDGNIRHEYRIPREAEPSRSGKEDVEPVSRRRSTRDGRRDSVSLHQDRGDGYSSTTEDSYKTSRSRFTDESDRRTADSHSSRYDDRQDSKSKRHHERRSSNTHDDSRRYLRPREDDREFPRAQSARRDRDKGTEREYVRRREYDDEKDRDRRYEKSDDRPEREKRHRRRHDDDYDRGVDDPRDDRHEREYRQRGKVDNDYERSPDDTREERGKHHTLHMGEGAAALGAAAASAAVYAKRRYDHHDSDSPTSKSLAVRNDTQPPPKTIRDDLDEKRASDSETDQERRERRRTKRRERDERERQDNAGGKVDGENQTRDLVRDEDDGPVPESRRLEDKDRRGRRHSKRPSDAGSKSGDETDNRQIRLVSPAKEPEVKPKGILKSPRVKFPEDPAPVREGVAPLKDAGKKGIPPNARWTKIDRRLVNPEALEFGNERFEERSEYVIVLRVLSKEEIEAYAGKTAEIRETRHREATRREQLTLEDRPYRSEDDEAPQLALENRAYNEPDMNIPGITDRNRQASIPGILVGDGKASAPPVSAVAPPPPQAANAAASTSTLPVRPEVFSSSSYVRIPPQNANGGSGTNYTGPSYPVPPPLQSTPMPPNPSFAGPAPAAMPHPVQPPPPNQYGAPPTAGNAIPPNANGPLRQATYPPPTGGVMQQTYPPPPPPLGTAPPPPQPPPAAAVAASSQTSTPAQVQPPPPPPPVAAPVAAVAAAAAAAAAGEEGATPPAMPAVPGPSPGSPPVRQV